MTKIWPGAMLFALLAALGLAATTTAQQTTPPPQQLYDALRDLSQRVGVTLLIGDLDGFDYVEQRYPDASLGCPQPGQLYAQVITPGWQITLTYQGVTYDYRVSNQGTVILCTQTVGGAPQPGPTPQPALPTLAPTLTFEADNCPDDLVPLLNIGGQGRLTPGDGSNLREGPNVGSPIVALLQPGTVFTVRQGPICGEDSLYWWEVSLADGRTGYVANGQNGVYFVEPIPVALPPADAFEVLNVENADLLFEVGRISGNVGRAVGLSPDGRTLALGRQSEGIPAVLLYDLTTLDTAAPTFVRTRAFPSSLAFHPFGTLLAVGGLDGTVELINVATGESIAVVPAVGGAVRGVSFSADGLYLVTVGDDFNATFYAVAAPGDPADPLPQATPTVTPGASPTPAG